MVDVRARFSYAKIDVNYALVLVFFVCMRASIFFPIFYIMAHTFIHVNVYFVWKIGQTATNPYHTPTSSQNNRIPKIVICCFAIDVWEPFLARFVGSHAIFRCDIFDYYLSCFRELFSGIKVPKHKIELLNLQWKFSDIVLLNVSTFAVLDKFCD